MALATKKIGDRMGETLAWEETRGKGGGHPKSARRGAEDNIGGKVGETKATKNVRAGRLRR